MSDQYPPPGEQPPGGYYPPPGDAPAPATPYGYPGAPAPGFFPAQPMAAHKPGAIPLRPLGLGDIFDAAFKIIRFNPKATVGSSVIVTSVAMLIPVIITAVISLTVGISASTLDQTGTPELTDIAGILGAYGALVLGMVLSGIGQLMVTGMNAHVALAAATGRKLGLGEAWVATHGKRWRLIGLTAMIFLATVLLLTAAVLFLVLVVWQLSTATAVVTSVLAIPALICLVIWLWIRVAYLAVPPLMLEPIGVFAAFGRAFRLTRAQFWRTFGIALLTTVVAQIAGSILQTPVAVIGQIFLVSDPHGQGVFIFILANAVGSVIAAAVISPFVTTVTSLQYLDQRIRKEAFDLELMARAGILAS